MGSGSVVNFDLSGESSNSYFKSSFARSMAFGSTSQSKSLDYVYLDEGKTISEEAECGQADGVRSPKSMIVEPLETSTPRKPRRSVPTLPTYELAAFPRELSASVRLARSRPNMTAGTLDPIKFWKMKQEAASKQSESTTYSTEESTILQEESKDDEILRLRKECQGLMEANRKLQTGASSVDSSLLQSQIDTLQWQLKQAESNRQMYKAVMEQVSKFLERVHKALEGGSPSKYPQRGKSRVPRSRSVHTVVTQSRASSPSPSHTINVHRANSITQMQDSYSSTYSRDCTWRGSRASAEDVAPERLSQDAFRLLRTVQSLLGTREPDLARVSDSSQRRDSTSMGSCSSLVQSSCCGTARESEDSKSNGGGPSTPQLSVGSNEDESGFSSMSSFHDAATNGDVVRVNGDVIRVNGDARAANGDARSTNGDARSTNGDARSTNGEGSHHELGLPLVEPHRHRRWSSTPVDTGFRQPLRVLWV